jgi:hypothetical protein
MNNSSDIGDRLEKLERSNSRLKLGLVTLILIFGGIAVMGAKPQASKVLEVEKLILRDAGGAERGELFANDKAWGFVLYNKNGSRASAMFSGGGMNAVVLHDQNGNIRQSITSNLEASNWSMYRPGSDSAQIEIGDNAQGTALTIRNRANNPQVELGISPKGSALMLSDEKGSVRTMIAGEEVGLATYAQDGRFVWSPGLENFTPEERARIKALIPKLPPPAQP